MPISKRTNHILIVAVASLNKTFPAAFFILSKRILRDFRIYAILVLWPFNSLTPHQKEIRKVKIFCYIALLPLAKKLIQNAAQLCRHFLKC